MLSEYAIYGLLLASHVSSAPTLRRRDWTEEQQQQEITRQQQLREQAEHAAQQGQPQAASPQPWQQPASPSPAWQPSPSPAWQPSPSPQWQPSPSPQWQPSPSPQYTPPPANTWQQQAQYTPPPSDTWQQQAQYTPPPSNTWQQQAQYTPPPSNTWQQQAQYTPPPANTWQQQPQNTWQQQQPQTTYPPASSSNPYVAAQTPPPSSGGQGAPAAWGAPITGALGTHHDFSLSPGSCEVPDPSQRNGLVEPLAALGMKSGIWDRKPNSDYHQRPSYCFHYVNVWNRGAQSDGANGNAGSIGKTVRLRVVDSFGSDDGRIDISDAGWKILTNMAPGMLTVDWQWESDPQQYMGGIGGSS